MKADQILSALGKGFLSATQTELIFGPYGQLLLRNIEDSWWKHCVVSSKYNVYPTKISQVPWTLECLRDTSGDALPFGLASVEKVKDVMKPCPVFGWPLPASCQTMTLTTFGDKKLAKDLFYRKQRERKAWWRKFSSNPSRFVIGNSEKDGTREIVDIQVRFPQNNLTIETVSFGKAQYFFQDSCMGALSESYVVEHTMSSELAFLAFLCDGYAEDGDSLHIHPKLAPYKALITTECEPDDEELLRELAIYLNNQLKADYLNTIVSSSSSDAKIFRTPYVIIVDNESLKSGIVRVTCQLTTIGEKVHITELVKHIEAICCR